MSSSIKDRLIDIHTQIQTNISQVHSNKFQCQKLSSRIDQLIDPLERLEHATSLFLREETRPILDNFLQCLDDCNNFIEKFSSSYEEIDENEKFEELNKRLSQFGQDLSLGLNIQEIFHRKQDQEDLIEKTNQLIQQQQEQYQLIDKTIHQQFQSLRNHVEQNNSNQQKQFLHIPSKDLRIKEKPIGRGGFADVYKGIWLTQHDQIAVKVLHINHLSENFYQEISIMYQIRYEHVVTLLGACIEPNFNAMIFEYMPLGSLYDVLHKITLSWLDRYSLAWQMSKSINYLHNLRPCIIHRDIKSMNFLLKQNGSYQHRFLLKVSDFGLAEIRRESLLQSTSCEIVGSVAWKAPELFISHEKHTKQSDVFSLGMTLWELATGKKPWDEYTDETVIAVLVKIKERPKIPEDVPEGYKQSIEDAWDQDPSKRPSCFHLMERMCKQMREITKKDELITLAKDLHCQQITESNLPTHTDSTRTAVSVAEENQRFTKRLSSIIISDYRKSEKESESSLSDGQQIPDESDNVSTIPRFERSLSKSVDDLSSNVLLIENPTRESVLPRSSIHLRGSIISSTITPSNDNLQNNHTRRNRHKSIIKQDTDSLPLIYRF